MCTTVVELTHAAERLRRRPRDGRAPHQVGRELRTLRHLIDLLELEFAATAAEFAATDEYEAQGAGSPTDWIRHECHLSVAAASQAVDVGEQASQMPASTQALLDG